MIITWRCHVCGDERPDEIISVYKTVREVRGFEVQTNVRYCNDRPNCVTGAPLVDLLGGQR